MACALGRVQMRAVLVRGQSVGGTLQRRLTKRPRVAFPEWIDPLFNARNRAPELRRERAGLLREHGCSGVLLTVTRDAEKRGRVVAMRHRRGGRRSW